MKGLDRNALEGPHDAEDMERSTLKQGKKFIRRKETCEPKKFGQMSHTPRNLGRG